jgi:large subunit ribosomal protein L4
MVTLPVFTPAGARAGEIELAEEIFGLTPNKALMHQAVVTTLANMRQGTADTKTRAEVHHTTRKLFRQKGTGRARQGMRSAPHWKGGGVVFGPHPRDYVLAFPKKMRRNALLCALSARTAEGAITVVEDFGLTQPKTKDALALLTALNLAATKLLIVLDDPSEGIVYSFRNLPNVFMTTVEMLGTYDILTAKHLLFSRSSIQLLQTIKQQPIGIAGRLAAQQRGAE